MKRMKPFIRDNFSEILDSIMFRFHCIYVCLKANAHRGWISGMCAMLTHRQLFLTANTHSLDDFICMQPGRGPGVVLGLSPFVQRFFKTAHIQQQISTTTASESSTTETTTTVNQVQAVAGNGAATAQ